MFRSIKEKITDKKDSKSTFFKDGFVAGIGWAFGVTLGFVIISTFVVALLNFLGGLPLIGNFIATIVEETQQQLRNRSPFSS